MKAGNTLNSGDGLFSRLPDAHAIVRLKGSYMQLPLYHRSGFLFVSKDGKVFDRLTPKGGTSHANMTWDELVFIKEPLINEGRNYLKAEIGIGETF